MFLKFNQYYSLNKLSINRLFGDSSWALFSQIFIVIVNLATVYILANLLSPNDYGQFKLITTWLAIAVGVGYTGYSYTLPQQIASGQEYNLIEILKKTFLKSLPAFLGLFIISLYYLYNQNLNLGSGFFFGAFLVPILCTATVVNFYYMGKKNFKMFALSQNFVDFVQLAAIALLAYYSSNFALIISLYFIATIIANLLLLFKVTRDDKKQRKVPETTLKQEVNYEKEKMQSKLNISAIVNGFVSQIDKLLLFHFVGAAPLAIYSMVTAISDQARTPTKAIVSAIFPRMTSPSFTKKRLYQIYFLLTLFCFFIFVTLIVIYPLVFKYIFPKYVDYIYLANIASLTILFAPSHLLYFYAQSKNQFMTINTYANLNTALQLALFPIATYFGSIILFLSAKILISLISLVYIFFKIRKI
jgi:O-antigen/teichoic acid export membrane protein